MSSKEKVSSRKANHIFKLSNLIILILLVLLALMVARNVELIEKVDNYALEALEYEVLKNKVDTCQTKIINTDAGLKSIKTDLQDLQVLRSDLQDDFMSIVITQDPNMRVEIANKQKAILEKITTKLVSIELSVDYDLNTALNYCRFT